MLTLKEFIAETLNQIVDGVRTAQAHAKEHGACVVPKDLSLRFVGTEGALFSHPGRGQFAQCIAFDVAITELQGKETKGGAGVFVVPFSLGSQGKSESMNQSVSRIKFTIPMFLPES